MVTILLIQALEGCSSAPASFSTTGLPVTPKADPGTPDWTNTSGRTGAHYGNSVSRAGDVDGDGYGDVVIGANTNSGTGSRTDAYQQGAVYVYRGGPKGLATTESFFHESGVDRANLGGPVNAAGDVDADGYDDVVAGATALETDEVPGALYAYAGGAAGPTALSWENHGGAGEDGYGWGAGGVGDVNGDGYADVASASPFVGAGTVHVFLGGPDGLAAAPLPLSGSQDGSLFGYNVLGVGDRDGDGYDDVLIGAPAWDGAYEKSGAVYLYRGSASGALLGPDWTYEGPAASLQIGRGSDLAGDLDGDGLGDVLIAGGLLDNPGHAWAFLADGSGFATSPCWEVAGEQDTAEFAEAVAGVGDVDGDGFPDVLVGSPAWTGSTGEEGAAYLYRGDGSGLEATPTWTWYGAEAGDRLGQSVAGLGDVNGDGGPDWAIGLAAASLVAPQSGVVWIWYGAAPPVDTGTTDSGPGDSGKTDSATTDSGGTDSGTTPGGDQPGTSDTAIRKPLGGCGCTTGAAPAGGLGGLLVGMSALSRARRRRG